MTRNIKPFGKRALSTVTALLMSATMFGNLNNAVTEIQTEPVFAAAGPIGYGAGTTGGAGGTSVTVSTGNEFLAAIEAKSDSTPLTIYVDGTITTSNSSADELLFKDMSDISVIGVGTNGECNGIGIRFVRCDNVIVQNMEIHHVPKGAGEGDAISFESTKNVWVDHCELYNEYDGDESKKDDYDGLLDCKKECSNMTYSYNYLHDSWKTMLSGFSDSDDYDRTITIHHNVFENCNSRLPLFRYGHAHIFNNYYHDVYTSGVNTRMGAEVYVENNVFENVKEPVCSLDSDSIGYWNLSGNVFTNCIGAGTSNSAEQSWSDGMANTCSYKPTYSYNAESTSNLVATLLSSAGVGGVSSDSGNTTTTAPATTTTLPATTTTTTNGSSDPGVTTGYVHNFTTDGTSSSFYTISGNLSTSKGTVSYAGLTLTQCLKMETATSISFNAGSSGTLTLVFAEAGKSVKVNGTKYTTDANGIATVNVSAGTNTITKGDSINLFYMAFSGAAGESTTTTTATTSNGNGNTTTTTTVKNDPIISGDLNVTAVGGWNEMMYIVLSGISDANVTEVSYTGTMNGTLSGEDFQYLVRDVDGGVRVDIPGLKPGTYALTVKTSKGNVTASDVVVGAQDRSGYAHFNYTAGVGAYNDDGTLKSNAIVLYVTDSNKNTVSVTSKDGTTVTGIGNILNSAGQDTGSGQTSKGGTPNTNSDIIEKIAKDGTPLVIRIIGNVTAPDGLTEFDSVNYGGSEGDNGFMARMQSGKDVTIEGMGTDACINGWGIHFIAESANTDLGKSFEVRNIAFRNVPEDCIGMEGVQTDSTLSAPVERCWIHNCEFYAPSISNPAESDKDGGDGACDFKRGMYFTNSYCYYEGYHKTNLVGASDSNLQYHITYHHNYWKDCESRGPLARTANIHMYNNIFDGQTSYCMNPRANAYIFSEYNLFQDSKDIMEVTSGGVVKSYNDTIINCRGNQQGVIVSSKTEKVSNNNTYGDFETNSALSYIPADNYKLETNTSNLAGLFEELGGCMDENSTSGSGSVEIQPGETTTTTTTTTNSETTTTTTTTTETVLYGDVNEDKVVNITDLVLLARFVAQDESVKLTGGALTNADCNGDQLYDATDITLLAMYIGGLSETIR